MHRHPSLRPLKPDPFTPFMPDGGHCPGCGSPLERVHRHRLDRFLAIFRSIHRYRCTDPECGWEGLVGREPGAPVPAVQTWAGRLAWLSLGAGLASGAMLVTALVTRPPGASRNAPAVGARAADVPAGWEPPAAAPGLHDDGIGLPQGDARIARNATPLELRRNCIWGVPGRTPYRGTVEQALEAASLPPEVVRRIAEMAQHGWTKDRLEISRTAIRSVDGRTMFKPEIPAMGFGNSLCFETKVNFPVGHVEYAAYYEAQDRAGKTYSVMVPYVCNNVSVLGVRGENAPPPSHSVPEPASWLLAGSALALLALMSRRRAAGDRP